MRKLSEDQVDVLTELINIGAGNAAAFLSELIGTEIDLSIPNVSVCDIDALPMYLPTGDNMLDTLVFQEFEGMMSGRAVLAFPKTSGLKLGQLLGGLDTIPDEFDLDLNGILTEVGNIVLNGMLGSISNVIEANLDYTIPEISVDKCVNQLLDAKFPEDDPSECTVILTDAFFRVAESEIHGSVIIVFKLHEIEEILFGLAAKMQ